MGITKSNEIYSAVSLSGGKDSSCLLILMIEKGLPINCVLYADTGMEFPEMEAHIARMKKSSLAEKGISASHGTAIHAIVRMGFSAAHRMNCLRCCCRIIAVMRNCG